MIGISCATGFTDEKETETNVTTTVEKSFTLNNNEVWWAYQQMLVVKFSDGTHTTAEGLHKISDKEMKTQRHKF